MPVFGVYPIADALNPGDEISSTYEGRHVTVLESDLIHPVHADGMVNKGDPVIFGAGTTGDEVAVGVALGGDANTVATDLIAVDTEGIWVLDVVATDDDGNSAVAGGEQLYINRTTAVISKNSNKNTHTRFGYALGIIAVGLTEAIAVKVHFDDTDPEELVGTSAANWISAKAGHSFREYRYTATNVAGDHRGQYTALTMTGAGASGEAQRGRTIVDAVLAGGVHGGHFGIEFTAAGETAGLGVGLRGTLLHKNAAHAGGTIAGAMSELYAEGALTDYSGATEHSIHRFVNDGEATGKATAQNVWSFAGLSATQLQAHNAWVAGLTQVLRVVVDGAVRYVGLSNAP